jgi:hypothetical protein
VTPERDKIQWYETEKVSPPMNELLLLDNGGSDMFIASFNGEYWSDNGFEIENCVPIFWCRIPKRNSK